MNVGWRWAGACSIGTSHLATDLPCQDRASSVLIRDADRQFISLVVSDGAGSASRAAQGAAIVCGGFQRAVVGYLKSGKSLDQLDKEIVSGWLDNIRDKISYHAAAGELKPRDFAATLIAAVIGDDVALVVHIGDGAAVLREEASGEWTVPSWPYQGEYASTTRFVIDDPYPEFDFVIIPKKFDRVAVFSDGIERLVLDHREKTAPKPFFDRLSGPVAVSTSTGRDRRLSLQLRNFLDSKSVCEATDDDKSLILAARA